MATSTNSEPGRDANGGVDPKTWAGKHEAREGRHESNGQGGNRNDSRKK